MLDSSSNSLIADAKKIQKRRGGFLTAFTRNLQLLKTYRMSQVLYRLKNIAKNRIRKGVYSKKTIGEYSLDQNVLSNLVQIVDGRSDQWRSQWSSSIQEEFEKGTIRVLNRSISLGSLFDWECEAVLNASHLWRFQLHYHEFFLRALCWAEAQRQKEKRIATQTFCWNVLDKWLDYHATDKRPAKGDVWHPYVISRRLPVWCQLLTFESIGDTRRNRLVDIIAESTEILRANFEWDLCGNHLLENFRGLAYAISVLEGRWRKSVEESFLQALKKQIEYQLLPSGEHYERSPMYHCQVTGILLELSILFQKSHSRIAEFCLNNSQRMMHFLESITHPDGEIPLFNDAVFQEAPSVDTLRNWSKKAIYDFKIVCNDGSVEGDYWVCGERSERLIVDCGAVSAHDLPAHGHCDLSNFEWSHKGERWITDSGVVDYSGSHEHFFCRSSMAHNVLTLNRESCCDIWGKFRMGRRGQIIRKRTGKSECGRLKWISLCHNGYQGFGVQCNRIVIYQNDGSVCLVDLIVGNENTKLPERVGFLHFAPHIELNDNSDFRFDVTDGKNQVLIEVNNASSCSLKKGLYCPEFGLAKVRSVLEYSQLSDSVPISIAITPAGAKELHPKFQKEGKRFSVQLEGICWTL